MSFRIDNNTRGPDNPALDIVIKGADSVARFREIVQRGTNLWPDAPPEVKEFADLVTVGHVQQDYHSQAKDLRKQPISDRRKDVQTSYAVTYSSFVASRAKKMATPVDDMMHAVVGMSGEAGELLDCIKKTWVYNKPLDVANVREELGDLLFYVQMMCNQLDCTMQDLIGENIAKLEKRYPTGYSDAAAQARADKSGTFAQNYNALAGAEDAGDSKKPAHSTAQLVEMQQTFGVPVVSAMVANSQPEGLTEYAESDEKAVADAGWTTTIPTAPTPSPTSAPTPAEPERPVKPEDQSGNPQS